MTKSLNTIPNVEYSVQTRGLGATKSLHSAVGRILSGTFDRFAPRIRSVQVWLEDVNGPRGGMDNRCRIDVEMRPRGRFTVSAVANNEYAATAEAAIRARETMDRQIKRARSRRRRLTRR